MVVAYVEAAVVLAVLTFWVGRMRRVARAAGLVCPACQSDLWGYQREYAPDREDYVLREGRCPKCRAQILHPADVLPMQEAPVSRLRTIVGMVVLIGLLLLFLSGSFRLLFRS